MGNGATKNAGAGADRFTKSVMVDVRKELFAKLKDLRAEQSRLMASLERRFNAEEYRNLSIINHRIEVTGERIKGKWLHGDYPDYVDIKKAIGSRASN